MSLFCLVHGSFQNSSCWNLLIPELEARGHQTLTVDLPTDERDASATHYADVIVQALEGVNNDAVLVGHSASGMFMPLVAQARPVRHLVFLASLIPKLGASIMDQFNTNPDMVNPEWVGKDPSQEPDEAVAMKFLFHDCTPEVARWALTTTMSLMYAERAMTEVCPLQVWPDVESSYIVCTDDRILAPAWSRRAARDLLGVDAIELPGGVRFVGYKPSLVKV